MEEHASPDLTQVLIEDLAGRVAKANLQASRWRTRALIAESALSELLAQAEETDQETNEAGDEEIFEGPPARQRSQRRGYTGRLGESSFTKPSGVRPAVLRRSLPPNGGRCH